MPEIAFAWFGGILAILMAWELFKLGRYIVETLIYRITRGREREPFNFIELPDSYRNQETRIVCSRVGVIAVNPNLPPLMLNYKTNEWETVWPEQQETVQTVLFSTKQNPESWAPWN